MEIDNVLRSIYYDQKHPSSFSTAEKLYQTAKEILPIISIEDVKEWLSGEFTYTLHKPQRKHFKRNPIIVEDIDQQWEADLVDMQEYKKVNKGFNYMLTVIDVLSKYAWAVPIKNKTSESIIQAFKVIFKDKRQPIYIRTDQGKEFVNQYFKKFLKKLKINHFTSTNQDIKCAVVERFNRTLKARMFKYFTAKGTRKWYDVIDDLVSAYNSSKHKTIKMTPIEASTSDPQILFENIYKVKNVDDLYLKNKKLQLDPETTVRKKYKLGPFDKSYFPNWTDETFKIKTKSDQPVKPVYKIADEKENLIKTRFYPEDIQKIKDNLYRVEKIIKRRKYNGIKQVFIKWLNYPDTYNSWVNESDVQKL